MKSKALCLVVGGLIVTAGAVGNTVFADTQTRPDNAQNSEVDYGSLISDEPTAPTAPLDTETAVSAEVEVEEEEQRSDEEDWRDHVTFNDEAAEPSKMLELDVYIKPTGNVNHALALYVDGK